MDDLLQNHRRRFRRRGRKKKRLIVLVVLLASAAAGWWWYRGRQRPEEQRQRASDALAEAAERVASSVQAARAPLEVDEPADDPAADRREQELTAKWSEGSPANIRGVLHKNQSVFVALRQRNLSPAAIHAVVSATGETFNFRHSRPGDEWFVEVDADGQIRRFRYKTSPEDIWETTRDGQDGYECAKLEVAVQSRRHVVAGTVNSSLWKAMVAQGEDGSLIYRFADIFAYTVDFNRATRPGDRFALVFNKIYLDGKFLRYGKILAVMYAGRGGIDYGFRYSGDEKSGYYDENGDNLQRQFLKSPLASVRVTSTFGKRFHPILHTTKLHNGVDYGAPVGTPIRAVADATVRWAARKGANGRLIVLAHANGYKTMYAHLSHIAKGIRRGKHISKKTIIGKTGNSGRSTGPHLHFGMTHNGKYVDPQKVDFARAEPLEGSTKTRFVDQVATPLKAKLDEAIEAEGLHLGDQATAKAASAK